MMWTQVHCGAYREPSPDTVRFAKEREREMRDPHPTQVPNGGCSLRQKRFTDEASNPVSRFRRRPQGRRQHNTQGRYSPRPPLSLSSVGGSPTGSACGLGFGFPESNHSSAKCQPTRETAKGFAVGGPD
jgi:hypothetical protein